MKENFLGGSKFFFQILLFVFISNIVFAQSSLQLISPKGGEVFQAGTHQGIAWNSKNIEEIRISYSIDFGKNWKVIFEKGSSSWW